VPAGVSHTYEILEAFTAVEATSPPAGQASRDAPPAGAAARSCWLRARRRQSLSLRGGRSVTPRTDLIRRAKSKLNAATPGAARAEDFVTDSPAFAAFNHASAAASK
jgi:hypothetical protein